MRATVLSNIVLDEIVSRDNSTIQSLGGPASYCGITARKFGFDTTLFTHFGKDLDTKYLEYLEKHEISLHASYNSDLPTTRFVLKNFENNRELILESNCSPIDIEEVKKVKSDCWIVSPVFDEVPSDILEYFTTRREKNEFIMLDPQGYTRVADPTGRISIRKSMDLPINNLDGIKLDNLEISCFTEGLQAIDGMKKIHSKYKIDHVMYTEDRTIHLLENERHYWLNVPRTDTPDSTGLGDIIVSSFACSIIKEKDPVWAICFAAGALTAALQTREIGIQKVPHKSAIEENASYYYNILNYEKI